MDIHSADGRRAGHHSEGGRSTATGSHRAGGGAGSAAGRGQYTLGVDSGGSGVRFALARVGSRTPVTSPVVSGTPVRTGPEGIDPAHLAAQLVPAVRELLAAVGGGELAAACVGAAGMATLGDGLRAELPGMLAREFGLHRVALAADAVTAYAGALGQRPGAVVAAGTGLIALGTDLASWRRADGWGHLLGDCGGGAWIGRAGLEAAMRAHDGRRGGSAGLLGRLEATFGPAAELPGQLYPRTDRPAVLASFAPEVAACAPGDPVAAGILRQAARHIADTAAAVCPPVAGAHGAGPDPAAQSEAGPGQMRPGRDAQGEASLGRAAPSKPGPRHAGPGRAAQGHDGQGHDAQGHDGPDHTGPDYDGPGHTGPDQTGTTAPDRPRSNPGRPVHAAPDGAAPPCEVALTGGLLKLGDPLLVPLHEEIARTLPHARLVPAAGDPLDGALEIASALATHVLAFPYDPRILHVSGHRGR